jgi:hypothetical protein
MELQSLLNSKRYVKGETVFAPPQVVVENFLEATEYDENKHSLRILTQDPVTNRDVDSDTDNTAYPRYMVEVDKGSPVILPDYRSVSGLLVALTPQKPMIKVYAGLNASACLNLCIFNARDQFAQGFLEGQGLVWHQMRAYRASEAERIENYAKVHDKLVTTYLNTEEINKELGRMLRLASTSGLGSSPIIGAAKYLDDRKSQYYIHSGEQCQLYNLYNAITQSITDSKDLYSKPQKTLAAGKLLGLITEEG